MSSPEDVIIAAIHTVKDTTLHVADVLDANLNHLATTLRDRLSHSNWLPNGYRPAPPPPPPPPPPIVSYPPPSRNGFLLNPLRLYRSITAWASENKFLATTLAFSLSLGGIYGYQTNLHHTILHLLPSSVQPRFLRPKRPKQKALRAPSGARTQVVLLSGHPHEQTIHLLALDLEKRGFIVYILVSTAEDERAVLTGPTSTHADIRPLLIDLSDPVPQLTRFSQWLNTPQTAAGRTHSLTLAGLILIPQLANYSAGPVEVLGGNVWADTMNINVLQPIVVVRACMRLLAASANPGGARVVVLTSAIVPALAPPFCALETVVGRATEGWVEVLEREVRGMGIRVALVKVGNVEGIGAGSNTSTNGEGSRGLRTPSPPSAGPSTSQDLPPGAVRADILTWPASIRTSYSRAYVTSAATKGPKGSSMKTLFATVVEALVAPPLPFPSNLLADGLVWRVGTGSGLYEVLAGWLPRFVVGWGLGVRRIVGVRNGMTGSELRRKGENGDGVSGAAGWEKVEKMA